MGRSLPWGVVISQRLKSDLAVSFTEESVARSAEYNYRRLEDLQLDSRIVSYHGQG